MSATNWDDLLKTPEVVFDLNKMSATELASAFTSRLTDQQVNDIVAKLGEVGKKANQREFLVDAAGLVLSLVKGILL